MRLPLVSVTNGYMCLSPKLINWAFTFWLEYIRFLHMCKIGKDLIKKIIDRQVTKFVRVKGHRLDTDYLRQS